MGGASWWWVYAFAPLLGGALSVGFVWLIYGPPSEAEEEKSGD